MIESYSLKEKKILLAGQVLNSLTEMVEDYLVDKAGRLGVIGISSPFSTPGTSRMTYYEGGIKKFNRRIFNIYFRRRSWLSIYLYTIVFVVFFLSILKAALSFRKNFTIFVGVSCFSAFMGIILKKFNIVKKVIYYSIDYFPLLHKKGFEYFMCKSFYAMDRFCVLHSDLIWHINPEIAEARKLFSGTDPCRYKAISVPLGYGEEMFHYKSFPEIERFTLGFVGTLSPNQGLQMVVKAFPRILAKFPRAKLEVIGDGIFASEIKKMAAESQVSSRIFFHGFIADRNKVSQILSHCAVGIAPWIMDASNNVKYADPGKPKHYAFCGLPIIITRCNVIVGEIEGMHAGFAINYDEDEFVQAVTRLFSDDILLQEYKDNALKFARRYISDNIYKKAWEESLPIIKNG